VELEDMPVGQLIMEYVGQTQAVVDGVVVYMDGDIALHVADSVTV